METGKTMVRFSGYNIHSLQLGNWHCEKRKSWEFIQYF